jgi:uncharacterized membrane protein YqiK
MNKRQFNMKAYDNKVAEIEQEKKDWRFQQENMNSLVAEIDKKQKAAEAEQKNWKQKAEGYNKEAEKWKKANRESSRNLARFKKLTD